MKTFSSLPPLPARALRGTCGVQMGMGTPPLMVPLRYAGLEEGLRLMVAVCEGSWWTDLPVSSGSANRLTVEEGRLDCTNFLYCRLRSEFLGMVEDLSKSGLLPWERWCKEMESASPWSEMDS